MLLIKKLMKSSNVYLSALIIGILGALFCSTKIGIDFEEDFGLAGLFKLRGALNSPPEVVIVSIDQISAEILHLPDDPEKWPRNYYAQLIEKLNTYHPALIAFNIHFGESRDSENDALLAKAMRQENNIILSNYLKQYTIPTSDPANVFRYERIIDPVPVLDQTALATAPFPLPKTFSSIKQFWTYKNTAGDIPTFPMTVFQYYVFKTAYSELLHLFKQLDPTLVPELPESFKHLNNKFKVLEVLQIIQLSLVKHPESLNQLDKILQKQNYASEKKQLLDAWLHSLNVEDQLYLNHYGRNGAIITLPFYQVLNTNVYAPELFNNKIILVGYSENIEPERNQGLYTIFTNEDGSSISPIEIAATAVANLLEYSWLKPLEPLYQFYLVLGWGCLLSVIFKPTSYKTALCLIILLSSGYLAVAYSMFRLRCIWIPVFTPLAVQAPIFLFMASISHFIKSRQEHRNIHKAFSFYLPKTVVNKIVQHSETADMNQYGEYLFGVCMATDAGQYTALSEMLNPSELHQLMNRYYAAMFPQVKNHQGMISDVIGDAMLALWTAPTIETQARINALNAALQIRTAIDDFNRSQQHQLPTRLGLHYGEMRLGNVGAGDHFEYRAIGDIINTTTRIENLNKLLNTQILVSESVISGLSGFFYREIGHFVLKGKTLPVTLYELIDRIDRIEEHWLPLILEFTNARQHFQNYQWEAALEAFIKINQAYPNDGPTLFYINYLKKHRPFPPLAAANENLSPASLHSQVKQPYNQTVTIEIIDN